MSAVDLLPCPFCGDKMENRGYGAIHVDGKGCPIGDLGIDPAAWNRRAPVSAGKVRALVWDDYSASDAWGGWYITERYRDDDSLEFGWSHSSRGDFDQSDKFYPTIAAAKAAAQADFEARILSAFEPGDGWRPIETAPRDGQTVLLHGLLHRPSIDAGTPDTVMGHWTDYNGGGWVWHGYLAITFTHWQPLPAPPAQGESQE